MLQGFETVSVTVSSWKVRPELDVHIIEGQPVGFHASLEDKFQNVGFIHFHIINLCMEQ